MAEMIRQIAASSDDCYVLDTIRLTRGEIFIAVARSNPNSYMRFLNIPIPPGSTIDHAHLELCSYGFQAGTNNFLVRGIKEPNPATFSTGIDAEARPVTAVSIPWNLDSIPGYFDAEWGADTWHGTPPDGPELKDIVQEIVDQGGWVPGNALAIKIEGVDTGISRSVWSWDGDPAKAAVLVITYTPPAMIQHALTISATIGGTTNPAPGAYLYDEGTPVNVLATPDAGYRFLNWDLDGLTVTDNPITVLMEADRNIVAIFEETVVPPEEFTVSISVIGQGTTAPAPGAHTVPEGSVLPVTAIPTAGWFFDHWEGDISGVEETIVIEVLADILVVAVFTEEAPQPGTIDRQIAASADDCYCYQTNISLTGTYIFIDECTFQMRSYFRFLGLNIPQGAVIRHAHLELCSDAEQGGRSEMAVYGIKEPNANTFSTQPDADARPVTAALADWVCGGAPGEFDQYWAKDTWHGWPDGPELKNIIQEIVNQPDWIGGPLAVKIVSTPLGGAGRTVWSWDFDPSLAARLYIEYEGEPVPPSKVSGLNATNIKGTSFSVGWNPAEGATLYRVYLRKV